MNDRRANPRMMCSELVTVFYRDGQGRSRRVIANLEDISLAGVCLLVDEPVPINSPLRIFHPKGEFQGSVRYCLFREIGYFLGIQFDDGCRWSPEAWRPSHLLDLRDLVERSAERSREKNGQARSEAAAQ